MTKPRKKKHVEYGYAILVDKFVHGYGGIALYTNRNDAGAHSTQVRKLTNRRAYVVRVRIEEV